MYYMASPPDPRPVSYSATVHFDASRFAQIRHGLGTRDVIVELSHAGQPVIPSLVQRVSLDTVTVTVPVGNLDYDVRIYGLGDKPISAPFMRCPSPVADGRQDSCGMFSHPPRCHDRDVFVQGRDDESRYKLRPGGWCSQAQRPLDSGEVRFDPEPLPDGGIRMPGSDLYDPTAANPTSRPLADMPLDGYPQEGGEDWTPDFRMFTFSSPPEPLRVVTFMVNGQTLDELDAAAQAQLCQLTGLAITQLGAVPYDLNITRNASSTAWAATVTAHLPGPA